MNIGDRTYSFEPVTLSQAESLQLSPLKMREIMQATSMTVHAELIAPNLVATSLVWGNVQIKCNSFVPKTELASIKVARQPQLDPNQYFFKITAKQGKEQYVRYVEKIIKKVESLFSFNVEQTEIRVVGDAFTAG